MSPTAHASYRIFSIKFLLFPMRRLFKCGAVILFEYCKQCCIIIILPSAAFHGVSTVGVSELLFEAGRERAYFTSSVTETLQAIF